MKLSNNIRWCTLCVLTSPELLMMDTSGEAGITQHPVFFGVLVMGVLGGGAVPEADAAEADAALVSFFALNSKTFMVCPQVQWTVLGVVLRVVSSLFSGV